MQPCKDAGRTPEEDDKTDRESQRSGLRRAQRHGVQKQRVPILGHPAADPALHAEIRREPELPLSLAEQACRKEASG